MKLGARVGHITQGGGDGWDVYHRARAMAGRGEPVVNLTIGEHDVATDPAILSAMDSSARGGEVGYTNGPGKQALREAVAARIQAQSGVATTWENVAVAAGCQGALFSAHMVLLDAGQTGLFIDPHYATYPGTIRATGAKAVAVTARSEDGFQPDAAALAAAARATGARTLLVNSPNNPTGVVYGRATLERIAQVARDADLWLISDEVYDSQVWEGAHLSPRTLPGMAERTVVVGSLSKSHAMTGSRLGWVVGPPEVIAAVTVLATNTTYGIPGYIQDAGLFALAQGPAFEAGIAAPFARRRAIAQKVLGASNVLRLIPADGAMFVMLDIRPTGLTGTAFADRLLADERIAVMPGESFGAASAGHIRVAMTVEDTAFADALERLQRFAGALTG